MLLFGCSEVSPYVFRQSIFQAGVKGIKTVEMGANLRREDYTKHNVLIIIDFKDLLKNIHTLNTDEFFDTKVVVFAGAVVLKSVNPIVLLDSSGEVDLSTFFASRIPDRVVIKDTFLSDTIDRLRSGSLLNSLMTWIYGLPSATFQQKIREDIVHWMFTGNDFSGLKDMLESPEQKRSISKRRILELKEILTGETSSDYITVFRILYKRFFAKQKKLEIDIVTLKEISDDFNVDIFEISYCLEIFKKMTAK